MLMPIAQILRPFGTPLEKDPPQSTRTRPSMMGISSMVDNCAFLIDCSQISWCGKFKLKGLSGHFGCDKTIASVKY